jgi:hypothetical protein
MNLEDILPKEFLEPNIRLYSFILLIVIGLAALIAFPVKEYAGYIDPFYSPTLLIIPIIGLFRLTCYAFRKDYNRHLFKHPLQCPALPSADSSARAYTGETSLFMKIENYHRYFMYVALAVLPFFYYDLFVSLTYSGIFVLRLGSILMGLDVVLLTLYVFSCHSIRNLVGGRNDCYGCGLSAKMRKDVYKSQSFLNKHHRTFAWLSLLSIIAVDLFIRALTAGIGIDFVIMHVVL